MEDKSFDKLFLRDIDRNYYLAGLKNSTKGLLLDSNLQSITCLPLYTLKLLSVKDKILSLDYILVISVLLLGITT